MARKADGDPDTLFREMEASIVALAKLPFDQIHGKLRSIGRTVKRRLTAIGSREHWQQFRSGICCWMLFYSSLKTQPYATCRRYFRIIEKRGFGSVHNQIDCLLWLSRSATSEQDAADCMDCILRIGGLNIRKDQLELLATAVLKLKRLTKSRRKARPRV